MEKIKCSVCGHNSHSGDCQKKVSHDIVFDRELAGRISLKCECENRSAYITQAFRECETYAHKRRKFCTLPFGCDTHYRRSTVLGKYENPNYKGKKK